MNKDDSLRAACFVARATWGWFGSRKRRQPNHSSLKAADDLLTERVGVQDDAGMIFADICRFDDLDVIHPFFR
jgi:hypothetical protein